MTDMDKQAIAEEEIAIALWGKSLSLPGLNAGQRRQARNIAKKILSRVNPVVSAEYCRRCGHENPSWSAPSPLWNAVMRGGSINGEPIFNDMVCAACFISLAESPSPSRRPRCPISAKRARTDAPTRNG